MLRARVILGLKHTRALDGQWHFTPLVLFKSGQEVIFWARIDGWDSSVTVFATFPSLLST